MRGLGTRAGVGRGACGRWIAALVLSAVVSAAPARAEEGGFFGFLRSALGGGSAPAPAAAPQGAPAEGEPAARPLTVRRTARKTHPGVARAHLAHLPAKTGPVSIFDDPTLRQGDAVMTKEGMRVFAGGRFSPDHPYSEADFVTVSASKTVAPSLRKTVLELNKLPPS